MAAVASSLSDGASVGRLMSKVDSARDQAEGPIESWPCFSESKLSGGGDDSGITFDLDVYDAVAVAAFGGVHQRLDTARDEDKATQLVHPFVLWLLSILLFWIQMSILVMLEVTEDVDEPVHEPKEELYEIMQTGNWGLSLLLTSKLIMVVVIQLMVFGEMFNAIKLLLAMVNPTTWLDIKGIAPEDKESGFIKFIFRTVCLYPWPALAVSAKLSIVYLVCVDSVSIVLCSSDVRDAIFNALALAFVADLDVMFWKFVSAIVHFEDFQEFRFRFARNKDRLNAFPRSYRKWLTPFRRGHGLRKIENFFIIAAMFYIYQRQLFIVLHALHTNVLPMARDLCTIWRFANGESSHFGLGAMSGKMKTTFVLVSPMARINQVGSDICHDRAAEFARMKLSDCLQLWREYPVATWLGLMAIAVALVVPQIVYSASIPFKRCLENDCQMGQPRNSARKDSVQEEPDYKQQIAELREMIAELEKTVASRNVPLSTKNDQSSEKYPLLARGRE